MVSINTKALDLAARTVHIKMHPTARTLAERREVLRVIERYGDVTMFRSYKYHPKHPVPNAFLSILGTTTAAKELINASPIRYRLISTPSAITAPTESTNTTPAPPTPEEKTFEISISPSNFNHETHLSSPLASPLRGPYMPTSPTKSLIGSILKYTILPSLAGPGLRDWETDVTAWRKDDFSQGGAYRTATGAARKRAMMERGVPVVMRGLRELKEEAERKGAVVGV